ncbi:MAG TPA: hypothetical protein PKM48_00960, partial [Parvularculaceae bacterium]|nr:hypothetical protein [Parvularculaceae bacterium]
MCFSAEASFVAAAGLAAIGAATLAQRPSRRMAALAATPLLFAAHQAIEGLVWLGVREGGVSQALIKSWVFIAEVFWPTFVPPSARQQGLFALLLTGLIVSG